MNIAWEVVKVIPVAGNAGVLRLLDEPCTILIDFLKQEQHIVRGYIPHSFDEQVRLSVDRFTVFTCWMLEVGKS
jgi:hypothetical protein